jgi:hypothetical protein
MLNLASTDRKYNEMQGLYKRKADSGLLQISILVGKLLLEQPIY